MYQWVRPRIALPVHGELRHMVEHASLAHDCQVPETIIAPNGSLVRLAPGPAQIIDHVPVGRLARDGDVLLPLDGETLRERRRLLWNGAAAVSLVLDRDGTPKGQPKVSLRGIEDADGALREAISRGLSEALADLGKAERQNDDLVEDAARQTVRRVVRAHLGKKPLTDVHIVRI
jgi:ribonuclease J